MFQKNKIKCSVTEYAIGSYVKRKRDGNLTWQKVNTELKTSLNFTIYQNGVMTFLITVICLIAGSIIMINTFSVESVVLPLIPENRSTPSALFIKNAFPAISG